MPDSRCGTPSRSTSPEKALSSSLFAFAHFAFAHFAFGLNLDGHHALLCNSRCFEEQRAKSQEPCLTRDVGRHQEVLHRKKLLARRSSLLRISLLRISRLA